MSRTTRLVAGLAALTLAGTGAGVLTPTNGAASTAERPSPRVLADGLLSPLSLAVSDDGTRYFSENFKGVLLQQRPGGQPEVLYSAPEPGTEVGAVSERKGRLRFALTRGDGSTALMHRGKKGKVRTLADLSGFESTRNPDGDVTYGFRNLPQDCLEQMPEDFPASYQGIDESHPYATHLGGGGRTYIADAAANAILTVSPSRRVRTVAVLPAQPLEVTAAVAEGAGLPECAVGRTYWFEPVPTDVEMGPRRMLYVTTLPGGPEDGTGAPASVYRVHPRKGTVTRVATGLTSAVGLAVGRRGGMHVAELFAGRITRISPQGDRSFRYLSTTLPGDVEKAGGDLFFTGNVLSGLSEEEGDVPAGTLNRVRR